MTPAAGTGGDAASRSLSDRAGLALVVAAQSGDRAALDRILRTLQTPLFEHIRFVIGDDDAARDVLQIALLSVARSLRQLRDPRLLSAWSFRIAHRAAIRAATRERLRPGTLPLGESLGVAAEEPPERIDPDVVATLHEMLHSLPPACGAAIRLRYLDELSLVEVAEALEVPVGTVKSRLHYGLALLRERFPAP